MNSTVLIAICICVTVILVSAIFVFGRRNNDSMPIRSSEMAPTSRRDSASLAHSNARELEVSFERVASLSPSEESRLVEITDSEIVSTIDATIPVVVQSTGGAFAFHKAVRNVAYHNKKIGSAGELYKAIIPNGAKLSNSRTRKDAWKGLIHGQGGIVGQADWMKTDVDRLDPRVLDELALSNIANSVMGVAAMVVGQYYMVGINGKLAEASKRLRNLETYNKVKFKSRVAALVAEVQSYATFRGEIVGNFELRRETLNALIDCQRDCAKLLGDANLMLGECTQDLGLDYASFEQKAYEANTWFKYQQILLEVMAKIAELKYVLHLGAVSKDYCYAMCLPYSRQAADVREGLHEWSKQNAERLEIDLDEGKRRRGKGEGGVLAGIAGFFNDDANYREVDSDTRGVISFQINEMGSLPSPDAGVDLYQEDVQIVKRDGRTYYLPPRAIA